MARKPKRRPYRKRKRAESEEETRRRITEAAVELHGTIGPSRTTMTELAERAGVSRMTVYNHFPTDVDLFQACSSHWGSRNPFPDTAPWSRETDPVARLEIALAELYGWYDRKQGMLGNVLRDAPLLPTVARFVDEQVGVYIERVVGVLSQGWSERQEVEAESPGLRASLRVAVDFHTWRTLTGSGLANAAAATLAARMVQGAHAAVVASG